MIRIQAFIPELQNSLPIAFRKKGCLITFLLLTFCLRVWRTRMARKPNTLKLIRLLLSRLADWERREFVAT